MIEDVGTMQKSGVLENTQISEDLFLLSLYKQNMSDEVFVHVKVVAAMSSRWRPVSVERQPRLFSGPCHFLLETCDEGMPILQI